MPLGVNMVEIKIYVTPSCPWSAKLKEWLKKKKLSFQEADVLEYDKEREEMVNKSAQMATPVCDIGGKIVVGFHENILELALKGES